LNSSELRERCLYIISAPLSQLAFVKEHEYVGVLLDERWIRILLVRRDDIIDYQRIEVELQTCPTTNETPSKSEATAIARSLRNYSRFVSNLIDTGFYLEIIENGCVWSLSKEFEGVPDEETLNSLCSCTGFR
jgi:hypothetical protein